MSRSFAIKTLLLSSLILSTVGFSGCGAGETAQPSPEVLKDDVKRTQERQDLIKEQYKNKAANPSK